jgi:glutamine transport system permease protein
VEVNWLIIIDFLPQLFRGAQVTLFITVAGLAGGIALGAVAGLMRAYGGRVLNALAFAYIELIRGTPDRRAGHVPLFRAAGARQYPHRPDDDGGHSPSSSMPGAYIAEIVRGAVLSVSKGLTEAGLAIGLPRWKVIAYIVGPLAFRRLIPPLGNQCIVSLKDTSLFIVIGVGELTRTGQEIMAANFRAVEVWSAVAIFYLVMTGTLSLILRLIERRMKHPMSAIIEFRTCPSISER